MEGKLASANLELFPLRELPPTILAMHLQTDCMRVFPVGWFVSKDPYQVHRKHPHLPRFIIPDVLMQLSPLAMQF